MRLRLIALAALAPLGACSTVVEAVKGPELAPVGYPAALAPITQPMVSVREPSPQSASANSLWRTGARAACASGAPAARPDRSRIRSR